MEDYKERLIDEYFQLCDRIEKLSLFIDECKHNSLSFPINSNVKLLDNQLKVMIIYKTHLEERAKLERIDFKKKTIAEVPTTETDEQSDLEIEDLIKGDA